MKLRTHQRYRRGHGLVPTPSTAEQMRTTYEADVERWRGVIADAKLKLQ